MGRDYQDKGSNFTQQIREPGKGRTGKEHNFRTLKDGSGKDALDRGHVRSAPGHPWILRMALSGWSRVSEKRK